MSILGIRISNFKKKLFCGHGNVAMEKPLIFTDVIISEGFGGICEGTTTFTYADVCERKQQENTIMHWLDGSAAIFGTEENTQRRTQ